MKWFRRVLVVLAVTLLYNGFAAETADAQRRVVRVSRTVTRPVIVRRVFVRDPFWYDRFWGHPFGYDPYFYDPYLRLQREKYYKEKSVRDAKRKINKKRAKYWRDGYLSFDEREELAESQRKYEKAVYKLAKFYREEY